MNLDATEEGFHLDLKNLTSDKILNTVKQGVEAADVIKNRGRVSKVYEADDALKRTMDSGGNTILIAATVIAVAYLIGHR